GGVDPGVAGKIDPGHTRLLAQPAAGVTHVGDSDDRNHPLEPGTPTLHEAKELPHRAAHMGGVANRLPFDRERNIRGVEYEVRPLWIARRRRGGAQSCSNQAPEKSHDLRELSSFG